MEKSIGVRRPEFREVSTIFSDPFLNLVPLLTRHVHILVNYNTRINITYIISHINQWYYTSTK
jgi:hypothetical protein